MKFLKNVIVVMAVLTMIFCLSGCSSDEKKAESAFNSAVTALQQGDFSTASKYIKDSNGLFDSAKLDEFEKGEELAKVMFSKLSFNVNSVEKTDDNTVKINTQITAVNMQTAFSNCVSEVFSLALSNAFASDDEKLTEDDMANKMVELLIENIQSEDAESVTSTIDVNMVKNENGWQVSLDDTVADAFAGGLLSATEALGGALLE